MVSQTELFGFGRKQNKTKQNNIKAVKVDVKKTKFTENIFVLFSNNSKGRGFRYNLKSTLKNILQRKNIFVKTFE